MVSDQFKYFFSFFISTALCIYLVHFFTRKYTKTQKKTFAYPPGPPALPIIGHMHLLGSLLHQSFFKLSSRCGPLMHIRAGATSSYVVSNAEIAKEIYKNNDIKFATRPDFGAGDFFMYKDVLFSTLDYNKSYIFLKKICMTKLLSTQMIHQCGDIRKEEMMNLLKALVERSRQGEACDLRVETMALTINIVSRIAISKRCSGDNKETFEIRDVAKGITQLAGKLSLGEVLGPLKRFYILGPGKRLRAILSGFDKLMDGIIMEHDQKSTKTGGKQERKDMMDILLQTANDQTAEMKLSTNGIKALFLDLLLGGTDTTNVALQWAMAELLNHPQTLKKLQEEIDKVVGSTRLIEDSDILNLPYLQAVVKETLRLHPPLPLVFRKCREDCKINGYNITKNARVVINLYAINRDPKVWEDAAEFTPERFLSSTVENDSMHHHDEEGTKVQNFSFVPFGGGRRGCPGSQLATAVLHRTLGSMIQCFDWKIKGANKIDTQEEAGLAVGLVHPLLCYPIMRLNPFEIA